MTLFYVIQSALILYRVKNLYANIILTECLRNKEQQEKTRRLEAGWEVHLFI